MIAAARAGVPASISTARAANRGCPAHCVPFQRHSLYVNSKGPASLLLSFCNGWTVASRRAYPVSASTRLEGKQGGRRGVEDGDDDFWDDDDFEEEEDEEEVEENGEDAMVPSDGMNGWLRRRPAGFGEGKTYDVSLEDKLMEEIEQSRKAQLANINKLKNSRPRKEQQNQQQHQQKKMKASEVGPGVSRVRIIGLPRKKNIHRDLKVLFEGFSDILSISPAVAGNKKTRDPICKGFAFVDFRSKEAAERFVRKYSNQTLAFGKVNKRIVCHVMNISKSEESGNSCFEDDKQLDDISKESVESLDDTVQGFYGSQINNAAVLKHLNQGISAKLADDHMNTQYASLVSVETSGKPNHGNAAKMASGHLSSVETQTKKTQRRKSEKKSNNKPKVGKLGSAIRLKSKERSVLTGALSKYSGKAVSASTNEK